ncbi:Fur family transcriptional regulator [Paracidovorax wautersii]|uniref:Fur family transcriptional regulator n=1 Tax=Paracidovorax wautersii TaxID=1177982 RepID=UPI0031D69EE1
MDLTANQQRVLSTLQQAQAPLSAYNLLDQLRGQGFSAPTQVYRALERLVQEGRVHRLESLNAYVSCACAEGCRQGPLAFAICEKCGHVDEFADPSLGRSLAALVKRNAFSLRESNIELRGLCASCAAQG